MKMCIPSSLHSLHLKFMMEIVSQCLAAPEFGVLDTKFATVLMCARFLPLQHKAGRAIPALISLL